MPPDDDPEEVVAPELGEEGEAEAGLGFDDMAGFAAGVDPIGIDPVGIDPIGMEPAGIDPCGMVGGRPAPE
jgi:hypothetical protein